MPSASPPGGRARRPRRSPRPVAPPFAPPLLRGTPGVTSVDPSPPCRRRPLPAERSFRRHGERSRVRRDTPPAMPPAATPRRVVRQQWPASSGATTPARCPRGRTRPRGRPGAMACAPGRSRSRLARRRGAMPGQRPRAPTRSASHLDIAWPQGLPCRAALVRSASAADAPGPPGRRSTLCRTRSGSGRRCTACRYEARQPTTPPPPSGTSPCRQARACPRRDGAREGTGRAWVLLPVRDPPCLRPAYPSPTANERQPSRPQTRALSGPWRSRRAMRCDR